MLTEIFDRIVFRSNNECLLVLGKLFIKCFGNFEYFSWKHYLWMTFCSFPGGEASGCTGQLE